MDRYASAQAYLKAHQPNNPVFALRPNAAGRAARWFLENFPGEVAYAYKANSAPFLIGALHGAGIRQFDVASLPELEDAATIPQATIHFMHPVKSRVAIRRAYFEFGVRCFALDTTSELEKIVEETGGANDLELFVRLAVPARNSLLPLERKFGIAGDAAAELLAETRQHCDELGICFHVGSQTATTDAFELAFETIRQHIVKAGVVVDAIDAGGGFPARYGESEPAPLADFVCVIEENFESLNPGNTLWKKQYDLYANVDLEAERYLTFEKWWDGYSEMTKEEIHTIVENLFVGDKLENSALSLDRKKILDLQNIEKPMLLFASQGDNITPPQQALDWIIKAYGTVDRIKA